MPKLVMALLLLCASTWAFAPTASAGAIAGPPGCRDNVLPRNDDSSTGLVPLPFTLNFLGTERSALYVNNNGNVTFDAPLATFTPFPLEGADREIIAPFFADVDTRSASSDVVTYGEARYGSRDAFCVQWAGVGVGYFSARSDKLNRFELLIVDRSDISPGDADIYFNYDQIQWETGDASGGQGGFGGTSARAGYSNGSGNPGTSLELGGSAVNGAFLDSNQTTGLIHTSRNTTLPGRHVFPFRNGFEAPNVEPLATLEATPREGSQPLEVSFDASASLDPDGTIDSWRLSFGDGAPEAAGTGHPPAALAHTYTAPGTHVATLTVFDDAGASDEAQVGITIRRAETTLVARAALAEAGPEAELLFPALTATLARADTGAALSGRTIDFYAGGELLCSASTDAQGRASCGTAETSLRAIPSEGYQALFAGDEGHLPRSAQGPLLRALGTGLP